MSVCNQAPQPLHELDSELDRLWSSVWPALVLLFIQKMVPPPACVLRPPLYTCQHCGPLVHLLTHIVVVAIVVVVVDLWLCILVQVYSAFLCVGVSAAQSVSFLTHLSAVLLHVLTPNPDSPGRQNTQRLAACPCLQSSPL